MSGSKLRYPRAGHPITVDEVARIFDDDCMDRLACIGGLPAGADGEVFAEGIRNDARIYAQEAREPTANELYTEIASLHCAAERRHYEEVASLIFGLSTSARGLLNRRPVSVAATFPDPQMLRDKALRDEACVTVASLCRIGGGLVDGRMRPSGKRSRTWRALLYAPGPSPHFPRRRAELNFVMHLRLTWLHAVGNPPVATVNPSRSGRPFVNLARECLKLVGGAHADAVGLINELQRRRTN